MKISKTWFFELLPITAMCLAPFWVFAGELDHTLVTEKEISNMAKKYHRAVLFGDSLLDTGNITKKINITTLGGTEIPLELTSGAPFTAGKGNMVQQLFTQPFINGNPLDWRDNFTLAPGFTIPIHIKSMSNDAIMDNEKNTNMAQGGAKMTSAFPGNDKALLEEFSLVARAMIEGYVEKIRPMLSAKTQSLLVPGIDKIVAEIGRKNITLVGRIIDQPAKFKNTGGVFDEHDLAIVMAGANDVIAQGYTGAKNMNTARQELIRSRQKVVESLISLGAKNIFLGNIPDLSVTPKLLNWQPGESDFFNVGESVDKKTAEKKTTKLISDVNEHTVISALGSAQNNPGVAFVLFDAYKMTNYIANNGELFGINKRQSTSCNSDLGCELNKDPSVQSFTQDGLHPSEKTSEILANSFKIFSNDSAEPLRSRLDPNRHYDAFFDSFADVIGINDNGIVSHHVNGGVLDLSLQSQANALTKDIKLSGSVLHFGKVKAGTNTNLYTHNLNTNIVISAENDGHGGGGIEVADIDAKIIHTGNTSGGSLLKSGLGTLVLTGENNILGMYISGGTLQVGDGIDSGWLKGKILNNSKLIFNRSDNKQFSDRIDGTGSLIKAGRGLLNLTGSGDFKGATEVRSGGLGFNGVFDSTDVQVRNGAFVYGTGKVRSLNLEKGAMISPGNSIGTFDVAQNISFSKGSIYNVDVNATGQSDIIQAGGVATIQGGDVLVTAESAEYSPHNLYTILTAEKQVIGRFDNVSANLAFLEPHLKYGMTDVSLSLIRNDTRAADLCQTDNIKVVCAKLLSARPSAISATPPALTSATSSTMTSSSIEPIIAAATLTSKSKREASATLDFPNFESARVMTVVSPDKLGASATLIDPASEPMKIIKAVVLPPKIEVSVPFSKPTQAMVPVALERNLEASAAPIVPVSNTTQVILPFDLDRTPVDSAVPIIPASKPTQVMTAVDLDRNPNTSAVLIAPASKSTQVMEAVALGSKPEASAALIVPASMPTLVMAAAALNSKPEASTALIVPESKPTQVMAAAALDAKPEANAALIVPASKPTQVMTAVDLDRNPNTSAVLIAPASKSTQVMEAVALGSKPEASAALIVPASMPTLVMAAAALNSKPEASTALIVPESKPTQVMAAAALDAKPEANAALIVPESKPTQVMAAVDLDRKSETSPVLVVPVSEPTRIVTSVDHDPKSVTSVAVTSPIVDQVKQNLNATSIRLPEIATKTFSAAPGPITVSDKLDPVQKPADEKPLIQTVSVAAIDSTTKPVTVYVQAADKPAASVSQAAETKVVSAPSVLTQSSGQSLLPGNDEVRAGKSSEYDLLERENNVMLNMTRSEFTQFSNQLSGDIHPGLKTMLAQESYFISDAVTRRLHDTELGLSNSETWGQVFKSEGRLQARDGASSFNRNTQGFVLGADTWIENTKVSVGSTVGYKKTGVSFDLSSADIETYNFGVYGSKRYDQMSMRIGANIARHDIKTKRKIGYKNINKNLDGTYSGNTAQLFSEAAYDIILNKSKFEPYVGLSYIRQEVSNFNEKKDLFSLSGKRQTQNIYSGSLGLRTDHLVQYDSQTNVNLQAGLGVKHIFSDPSLDSYMHFRSQNDEFKIIAPRIDRNVVQLDGKLTIRTKNGLSAGIEYMTERGTKTMSQSVSAFSSWEF